MRKKNLLLGIGNILMMDEGIGIHVIKEIEKRSCVERDYDILDGGTGGFNLIYELIEYENVIIVDAIMDGRKPGSISVRCPKYSRDFPEMLSAHDFGLKAMIDSLIFMDRLPKIYVITVTVESINQLNIALTKSLSDNFSRIVMTTEYLTALIMHYINKSKKREIRLFPVDSPKRLSAKKKIKYQSYF